MIDTEISWWAQKLISFMFHGLAHWFPLLIVPHISLSPIMNTAWEKMAGGNIKVDQS